jgi:hypothetical protein
LFRSTYELNGFYPEDTLINKDGDIVTPDRSHFMEQQSLVIAKLKKAGLI